MNKRQYESRVFRSAERVVSVVMLFYTMGAVMPFLVGKIDPLSPTQIRPTELIVKVTLYSVTFYFIAIHWRSVIQSARNIKWIVSLVLIAVASTAWSQDPSLTLRGSAVLLATTAFGVYFGTRYTVPQQLRLLAWTCFLVVVFSYFFAIFLPRYGVSQDFTLGDWPGVLIQKNGLTKAAVLGVVVFLFVRQKPFQSLRWLGVAASLGLLFLSRSATGMIVCAAIITMLALYRLVGARDAFTVPFIFAGLLLVGLLLFQDFSVAQVFQLVDRSPDLTGRTNLWNAVLLSVSKRPLLGYGFSAFWQGMNGESGICSFRSRMDGGVRAQWLS